VYNYVQTRTKGLDQSHLIGLDWIGLDWIDLDWIGKYLLLIIPYLPFPIVPQATAYQIYSAIVGLL